MRVCIVVRSELRRRQNSGGREFGLIFKRLSPPPVEFPITSAYLPISAPSFVMMSAPAIKVPAELPMDDRIKTSRTRRMRFL